MKLLPNEDRLLSSNGDKVILTNYRILMTESVWGQSFSISIFLEDISSIETKYKSNIFLLIIGAICVLVGFYSATNGGGQAMVIGVVIGGIFFAIWWFTRKHIISISSNGGALLNFMVQGMDDDIINNFVYRVSLAKLTRVNQLHKS